jgi:hypothetical protein
MKHPLTLDVLTDYRWLWCIRPGDPDELHRWVRDNLPDTRLAWRIDPGEWDDCEPFPTDYLLATDSDRDAMAVKLRHRLKDAPDDDALAEGSIADARVYIERLADGVPIYASGDLWFMPAR